MDSPLRNMTDVRNVVIHAYFVTEIEALLAAEPP
jgi:hypothetical protein